MSAIGFPDFRRQSDWDSPTALLNDPGTLYAALHAYPTFFVGNFAYLVGSFALATNPAIFKFTWSMDSAGAVPVGTREFNAPSGTGSLARICIPNLGRYCQLTVIAMGGGNITPSVTLFASNRKRGSEALPVSALVSDHVALALAAAGLSTLNPNPWVSGRAMWYTQANAAAGSFFLETLTSAGVWRVFAVRNQALATNGKEEVFLPWSAWRSNIQNTGAGVGDFFSNIILTPDS